MEIVRLQQYNNNNNNKNNDQKKKKMIKIINAWKYSNQNAMKPSTASTCDNGAMKLETEPVTEGFRKDDYLAKV